MAILKESAIFSHSSRVDYLASPNLSYADILYAIVIISERHCIVAVIPCKVNKSVFLSLGSTGCRNLNKINMLNRHLAGAFPFLLRRSVVAHKRTPKGGRRKEAGFDLLSGIILL